MVTSVTSAAGERIVTFGVYQGEDTDPLEVIAIYTESGESPGSIKRRKGIGLS